MCIYMERERHVGNYIKVYLYIYKYSDYMSDIYMCTHMDIYIYIKRMRQIQKYMERIIAIQRNNIDRYGENDI